MSDDRAFDRAVHDWLEAGSDRTPTPAVDAVLLAVRMTPQERDLRILRRTNHMSMPIRLAAGVAIIAILGFAALTFTDQDPGVGSTPSATPTATASPSAVAPSPTPSPVSTATWRRYISDRYLLSISHPADWTVQPADRDWAVPSDGMSSATEGFLAANEDVLVSAWSLPVEAGTVLTDWIEAYCLATTEPCTEIEARAEAVTLDGHPAVLVPFASDVQAFALVDDRIYVLAAWRRETWYVAEGVQLRQYFDAYLSTVRLLAGPASG